MSARSEPSRSIDPKLPPAPGSPELALLAVLARAHDRDALVALLARSAVSSEGAGGLAAHALVWDATTGLFERRLGATASESNRPDAGARHAEPGWPAGSPPRGAWDLEGLDATCRDAWNHAAPRIGSAAGEPLPWGGAACIGVVPLLEAARPFGLLVIELDADAEPAERLERFARVVELALEARGRADELTHREAHAAGLVELAQTALAPRNVAEVLHTAARLAAEPLRAEGAAIWARDEDDSLVLRVAFGPAGSRERVGRALHAMAVAAIDAAAPRIAWPASDDVLLPAAVAAELGGVAIWPILAYGQVVGALGVWVAAPAPATEWLGRAEREYLSAAASIVGMALDHARRFGELREAERREREAVREARRREALATLGEMAAKASQESLKPVASIRAFASRLEREIPDDDARRDLVEVILREADRLERILREQQAHAELAPPTYQLASLNALVESALDRAGETLVRRRARVLKRLAPDLPALLLDPRGVEHVLRELLTFALDSIALGGRVRLETRKLPKHVLMELGHDGVHTPGLALEQLFLPFSGAGRPGRGLSVARRVIQEHGGEIRVRAEGEWTTIVTFTLPIVGNQDRRGSPSDRRSSSDRRRTSVG